MNERVFELISNFAKAHIVKIEFTFDCVGHLIIDMTRDTYSIRRTFSNAELHWFEDCDDVICRDLNNMLVEINKNYDKQL